MLLWMKKRRYKVLYLLSASVVLAAVIYFLSFNVTPLRPELVQQPDQIGDFPSSEEGTLSGTLKEHYFKEKIDPVVVLFASARIPGLSILYYPEKNMLVGGSPALMVAGVSLFDGQRHSLLYSFKREGMQALVYDQKVVASGKFELPEGNMVTGLVTGAAENVVSEGFETVEVR